jgi:hypothetical protein
VKNAVISFTLGVLALSAAVPDEVKEVRKTLSLNADGRVTIDTYKGSITVTGWDSPSAEIHVRIEPDGWWGNGKESVRNTEIQIDSSPGSVRIKSDYSRVKPWMSWSFFDGSGNLPFVHYTIKMPRTAQLAVKDYKSKIDISDLRSDLTLKTYKGTATISGLDGSMHLDTYKGDVRVRFANLARASRLETYKGEIQIEVPRGSRFDLDSEIGGRGRLDAESELKAGARGRYRQYRLAVNGGGPALHLKTYRGTFRLRRT